MFVVFDGNSINRFPAEPNTYPTQMLADTGWAGRNEGLSSHPWGQLDDTFAMRCAPHMKSGLVTVYAMVGGILDYQLGASGATVYTRSKAMATLARAASPGTVLVVASTTTPYDLLGGAEETARLAGNTTILADADNAFDDVVDLCASPMHDPTNTTYYSDGVHPTATGASMIADRMAAAITALL